MCLLCCQSGSFILTLFQLLVFLRSVQMATNQKVLSNRASDKSRVSRVGSIVIAVSRAFQKGGGRLPSEQVLALYIAEGDDVWPRSGLTERRQCNDGGLA